MSRAAALALLAALRHAGYAPVLAPDGSTTLADIRVRPGRKYAARGATVEYPPCPPDLLARLRALRAAVVAAVLDAGDALGPWEPGDPPSEQCKGLESRPCGRWKVVWPTEVACPRCGGLLASPEPPPGEE